MPARAGRFSDYQANIWLSALIGQTKYMTLFSSDPYSAGSFTAVEITSSGFARQTFTESLAGRLITVTSQIIWSAIPAGSSLTHMGICDAAFNGNLICAGPIPNAPLSYTNGGSLTLPGSSFRYGVDI